MEFGGAAKRGRPEGAPNGNGGFKRSKQETESFTTGIGSKLKPCTKFFSPSGCPYGENCHFLHYVQGGIKAVTQILGNNPALPAAPRNPVAAPPSFSDGPPPVVKSRLCNKYKTAEGCKFGDSCRFAHGEWELGKPTMPSYEDPRAMGQMPGRYGGGNRMEQPNFIFSKISRCLDKAATITADDRRGPNNNPWRLCTVTQVEEAKCIIRMLPIWLCTIIYSVVFTQMASLFVEQGEVMHAYIGKFKLPAASMSAFDICSVLLCTGIYRQVLVPLAGRLSGNPKGLTELQRMGIGLIIGMFAMIAAGITEIARLRGVVEGQKASSMSIFWQIPQYVLVGASEVFMYVGQLEFFNGQAPDGIKSFGSSLCMASISLGNFVSSLLVNMVMGITATGDSPGWIPEDLNHGHMDRFYFLIAVLTGVDFMIYLACARWYKSVDFDTSGGDVEGGGGRKEAEEQGGLDRV